MYNFIKLNNHSSLNFKKRKESTNKFFHTPAENSSTSSKTRIPLAAPSVLILTHPSEGNSHLTGREQRILPLRVLIPKNLIMFISNISFFIETLDEFPTRQVKSLIIEIALETLILS